MSKQSVKKFAFLIVYMLLTIIALNAQSFSEEIITLADVVVDINGSGDYTTVQEAINSIPDDNGTTMIIFVMNGIYHEKVILNYKKTNVILVGEDVDSTIITWDDYGDKMLIDGDPNNGGHTFSTYTFRADAHGFQAYNISFENPTTLGQGVAYHSNGDRQILYHCRILGNQDTYFDNFRTRKYLKDCFIEGGTDFIFGFGVTLFDSCQIHSNTASEVTAASTPEYYEFGQVFRYCRLTAAPGMSISLGRPWFDWSNTIFYECWEPEAVKSAGWSAWSGREATCIYREYNCFGPGSDTLNRVDWGKQLAPSKAPRYVIDTIFAASNFPSDLGYTVDTNEFYHVRRRFEASGYPARADTIIFAGREDLYASGDSLPPYPTENWSPEFYNPVLDLVNKYTVPFMDSINGEISIDAIYWNDNPVSDFAQENPQYVVELDDTVTIIPELSISGSGISVSIAYPASLPDAAIITATSRDKVAEFEYTVYFSQDSAYWETELDQVIVNRKDTLDIIPGVYDYNVTLQEGATKITSLIIKTKVPGQTYSKQYPANYPGIATIEVTAPDGETSRSYNLNVSLAVSLQMLNETSDYIRIVNPAAGHLQIYNERDQISDSELRIYDLSGKMLFFGQRNNLIHGINETDIDISGLDNGIYIYRIIANDRSYCGKFIKVD